MASDLAKQREAKDQDGKIPGGEIVQIFTRGARSLTFARRGERQNAVNVDAQFGQVLTWAEEHDCYVVHTFEGLTVLINEFHLEPSWIKPPEQGGADLVYPVGAAKEDFGNAVGQWLWHKGFCVVQMSQSSSSRDKVAEDLADIGTYMHGSFAQEFESAYLGANNTTHVLSLPPEDDEVDAGDPARLVRQQMRASVDALEPFTEAYFGDSSWATTSMWARLTSDIDNDVIVAPALIEKDATASSCIQSYDRFIQGRTVCVMYFVKNDGGEIHLWPRLGSDLAASGGKAMKLPLTDNKMLIFRHDQMSYSYQPKGASFALQFWMLTDIPIAQQNLQVSKLSGVKGPPPGENAQIMMIDTLLPADAVGLEKFWQMLQTGTDADSQWPVSRWPLEPYYTDGDDAALIGKSYTKHGGFMNECDMHAFDNEFFDITDEEAHVLCPGSRHTLMTAYSCLFKSGHTRGSLQGENIGIYLGDSGMDWHNMAAPWSMQKHKWAAAYGPVATDTTVLSLAIHVGVTAGRLHHLFGLTGPIQTADTACSASLVALQAGHKAMMHLATDDNLNGSISAPHSILGGGVNTLMTPASYIENCAGGMLSHVGRCWTFDRTADGYQRGEGTGSMFLKWSGDDVDIEERLACLVGSCSGHDGRSASLTAPNGPAQQDCIRRSMRMAGVDPSLISVCECHGTGTALGDPIEIGSLQGVMRGMRTFPLLNTSAKTNISHLEAGAGMAGVMKCVMMVTHSAGPPNCHLRQVNANLITAGYPVFFQQELADTTFSTTFIGVSSFGFGGTNSRADVYGRCLSGARDTGNVWTPERFEARQLAYSHGLRNSYKGYAKLDKNVVPKEPMFIVGSWSGYKPEKMDVEEPGCFTFRVRLGGTRIEHFQFWLAADRSRILSPCIHAASATAEIAGPDHGQYYSHFMWQIDGKRDAQSEGAAYCITFKWQGEKSLRWKPEYSTPALMDEQTEISDYAIIGSWSQFKLEDMKCIRKSEEDALYAAEVGVGRNGKVRFQFQRVGDKNRIYPSELGSLCGPDQDGLNKYFSVEGLDDEKLKVQLKITRKKIAVDLLSFLNEPPKRSWLGTVQPVFYVTGSCNGWRYTQMTKDKWVKHVYKFAVRADAAEEADGVDAVKAVEYQIHIDSALSRELNKLSTLFPDADAEALDAKRSFELEPGSMWEIILDLNQDDSRRMIYHRPATLVEKHVPIHLGQPPVEGRYSLRQ